MFTGIRQPATPFARAAGRQRGPIPQERALRAPPSGPASEPQPVRLRPASPPELAGLPWEALPRPDSRGPLALHPLVSLFRKTDAAGARLLPGPLRIVVAIAAPDLGGGAVLDYQDELRNVLAAVRAARRTPRTWGSSRSQRRPRSAMSWARGRRVCAHFRARLGRHAGPGKRGRLGPDRSPPNSSWTRPSRQAGSRR